MALEIVFHRKPRRRCGFCGLPFYENEEVKAARHAIECVEKNQQALQDRRDRIAAFDTLEGKADVEREQALSKEIVRDIRRGIL